MTLTDANIHDIKKLCSDHSVKELYVFGSVLTSSFTQESDIDFLVAFEKVDTKLYADNYYELKYGLQKILQRPIDLLEDKALKNPYLRKEVIRKRELVYGHYS